MIDEKNHNKIEWTSKYIQQNPVKMILEIQKLDHDNFMLSRVSYQNTKLSKKTYENKSFYIITYKSVTNSYYPYCVCEVNTIHFWRKNQEAILILKNLLLKLIFKQFPIHFLNKKNTKLFCPLNYVAYNMWYVLFTWYNMWYYIPIFKISNIVYSYLVIN